VAVRAAFPSAARSEIVRRELVADSSVAGVVICFPSLYGSV
jgi:hypothetical protein